MAEVPIRQPRFLGERVPYREESMREVIQRNLGSDYTVEQSNGGYVAKAKPVKYLRTRDSRTKMIKRGQQYQYSSYSPYEMFISPEGQVLKETKRGTYQTDASGKVKQWDVYESEITDYEKQTRYTFGKRDLKSGRETIKRTSKLEGGVYKEKRIIDQDSKEYEQAKQEHELFSTFVGQGRTYAESRILSRMTEQQREAKFRAEAKARTQQYSLAGKGITLQRQYQREFEQEYKSSAQKYAMDIVSKQETERKKFLESPKTVESQPIFVETPASPVTKTGMGDKGIIVPPTSKEFGTPQGVIEEAKPFQYRTGKMVTDVEKYQQQLQLESDKGIVVYGRSVPGTASIQRGIDKYRFEYAEQAKQLDFNPVLSDVAVPFATGTVNIVAGTLAHPVQAVKSLLEPVDLAKNVRTELTILTQSKGEVYSTSYFGGTIAGAEVLGRTVKKGGELVKDVYIKIGTEKVPAETVFYPESITGEKTFFTVRSTAESLEAFNKGKSIDIGVVQEIVKNPEAFAKHPVKGTVLLSSEVLRDIQVSVPQENIVYTGGVARRVLTGEGSIRDVDVVSVSPKADAYRVVRRFPEKYEVIQHEKYPEIYRLRSKKSGKVVADFDPVNLAEEGLLAQSKKTTTSKAVPIKIKKGDVGHVIIKPQYSKGTFVELYHGTSAEAVPKILSEGLKSAETMKTGGKVLDSGKRFVEEPYISATFDKSIAQAYAGEKGKIITIKIPKKKFKNMYEGEKMEAFDDPFSTGEPNIAFEKTVPAKYLSVATEKTKTFYHGTSFESAQSILKTGLKKDSYVGTKNVATDYAITPAEGYYIGEKYYPGEGGALLKIKLTPGEIASAKKIGESKLKVIRTIPKERISFAEGFELTKEQKTSLKSRTESTFIDPDLVVRVGDYTVVRSEVMLKSKATQILKGKTTPGKPLKQAENIQQLSPGTSIIKDQVIVTHISPAKIKGLEITGKIEKAGLEDPGLFVAPKGKGSVLFTGLTKTPETTYSLNPFKGLFGIPSATEIAVRGAKTYPKEVVMKPGFEHLAEYQKSQAGQGYVRITKRSQIGFGDVPRQRFYLEKPTTMTGKTVEPGWRWEAGTTETEGVIGVTERIEYNPKTWLGKIKGFEKYTVIEGRAVAVREARLLETGDIVSPGADLVSVAKIERGAEALDIVTSKGKLSTTTPLKYAEGIPFGTLKSSEISKVSSSQMPPMRLSYKTDLGGVQSYPLSRAKAISGISRISPSQLVKVSSVKSTKSQVSPVSSPVSPVSSRVSVSSIGGVSSGRSYGDSSSGISRGGSSSGISRGGSSRGPPPREPPPTYPKVYPRLETKEQKKEQFRVEVRKKGVFKTIAVTETPEEAFRIGKFNVEQTASASLRVKPIGSGEKVTGVGKGILPLKKFRQSQKEPDVFIQRRKFRIGTPGEKKEITYKGLMVLKGKRRFGGLI